jgi:hypothetical protein
VLLDSNGRLLGKYNIFDAMMLGIALLIGVGLLAVQSGWHQTSGETIKGEADIEYTVLLRNLKTLKKDLFVPGKTLSITIRNQPRGEVTILDAQVTPKKLAVPTATGEAKVIDDPADLYGYDYLIQLKDHALVTDEGYVTEGIKVKVGLPIEVEGFDYRVNGVIADVKAFDAAQKAH